MTCHYYYGGFIHVDPSQKSYIGGGSHPRVTTFCFNHDHVPTAPRTHAVEPRGGRPRAGGGEAQRDARRGPDQREPEVAPAGQGVERAAGVTTHGGVRRVRVRVLLSGDGHGDEQY